MQRRQISIWMSFEKKIVFSQDGALYLVNTTTKAT